jgi:error-prone DNA polymerase
MDAPELAAEPDPALPPMPLSQQVVEDYQTQRLSLRGHPLQFLRARLEARGIITAAQVNAAKDGAPAACAGAVLVRQRPGKGNAIFITIEDETGIVNGLLWARAFEKQRSAVMAARLMVLHGKVQHSKEGVVHLMIDRVVDASVLLAQLEEGMAHNLATAPPRLGHHPRDARLLPPSRDFH